MTQMVCFYIVTADNDLLAQTSTQEQAFIEMSTLLDENELQRHMPVRIIMEDMNGCETVICTIQNGAK